MFITTNCQNEICVAKKCPVINTFGNSNIIIRSVPQNANRPPSLNNEARQDSHSSHIAKKQLLMASHGNSWLRTTSQWIEIFLIP